MRKPLAAVVFLMSLAGCATPPPGAFVRGTSGEQPAEQIALGANAAGETCTEEPGAAGVADIYCGTWRQPSAHVAAASAFLFGVGLMKCTRSCVWPAMTSTRRAFGRWWMRPNDSAG